MKAQGLITFLFFLLLPFVSNAQASLKDTSKLVVHVAPSYALQVPDEDMAERFGLNSSLSMETSVKFASQWELSLQGDFLFGNRVKNKDSLLTWVKTSKGEIVTREGDYAPVEYHERGFMISLSGGRLFPAGPNPNSGFFVRAGAGYIQHNIRVELGDKEVPQLDDEYEPYYDRLAGGFMLRETIGYRYLDNKGMINFFLSIGAVQGFTTTMRDYNIDAMGRIDDSRTDFLYEFRAGWILPLHKRAPDEFYFY